MARISIVGAGPGSPDYITPLARKIVKNADVVIGADRALILFADDIQHETIKLTAKTMNASLKKAVELAQEGRLVAVLSTGDPGFSGLLKTFLKLAQRGIVEVDVVPGISSVQVCAARLGISWDDAELFTFHESASAPEKERLLRAVNEGRKVMLLPDSKSFPPSEIADFLLKHGVDRSTLVFVCENLTLDGERIVKSTIGEVTKAAFSSLCVMVIKPSLQQ